MTRDYSLGKIYKIVCNQTGKVYIGQTCKQEIKQRIRKHKSQYREFLNQKLNYRTSFEILKNNDYKYELIEEYPCENNKELMERERFWINNIENVVNIKLKNI